MEIKSVNSSNISSIGYDTRSRTLFIEFHGGRIYQYSDVPPSLYEGLMSASSHGTYFDRNIKRHPDRFTYVRLS